MMVSVTVHELAGDIVFAGDGGNDDDERLFDDLTVSSSSGKTNS
jgi:hypothetical protein